MTFISYPSLSASNASVYAKAWLTIGKIEPSFLRLKTILDSLSVNEEILPSVVRAIFNVAKETGYGKISIFVENKVVTGIKPELNIKLDLPALKENEK